MIRPRKPRVSPTDYPRMQQWTALHALMLSITVVACGVFIVAARRIKGTSRETFIRRMVGWALLVAGTAWTVISLDPKQFDIRESLPLHLCDVLRPVLALGLITGNEHALTLTYFWGIILNPQAIVTPDVIYYFSPRWLRFGTYWFFHIVALAVPLALTFGLGYRPTWKGYRFAVKVTPVWMALAMAVNAKTDGNYGFLNHAPGSPSIINLLGPWPGYIVAETLAVLAAWAGLTWPWENTSLRRGTVAVGPRGLMRKSVGTASGILRRATVRFRKSWPANCGILGLRCENVPRRLRPGTDRSNKAPNLRIFGVLFDRNVLSSGASAPR